MIRTQPMRITRLIRIIPVFVLALCAAASVQAQITADSVGVLTITYTPPPHVRFADGAPLDLVYVFNYWGTRSGTRLALLENVLRPDSARMRRVPMERRGNAWAADVVVPANGALLSYYITDGTVRDDNRERTYVKLMTDGTGKPLRNAHFFNTPFLQLAGAPLDDRVAEAEREVLAHPDNFRTWSQYFTLYLERNAGSAKSVGRIVSLLEDLERKYPDTTDCLNLIARTYFYVLQDVDRALDYRNRIPASGQWPEVVAIYNREQVMEERRRKAAERAATRDRILNAEVPDVTFSDWNGTKHRLREEPGTAVVVFFWATTSEHSRNLIEPLARLHERWSAQGVRFLDVNLDVVQESAMRHLERHALPFEHRRNNGTALIDLGIDGIPNVMVLDARRNVRAFITGVGDDTALRIEQAIREALAVR